jgi:hypothetical protein
MATRRGIVRLLVLVLAGLAVAGTSPAPTRPPTVQAAASGALELGPDRPMAAVEVTVTASAALLADATNRTQVTASRVTAPGETGDDPLSAMAIEVVGGGQPATTGTAPTMSDPLTAACRPAADCTRTYRISAALAGRAEGPVKVGWRVVAESRTGTDAKPGVPPAGSALTVTAGDPTAIADRSTAAAVASESVRLDPSHPRFVRTVTIVEPPHPAAVLVAALRSSIRRDHPDRHLDVASVGVASADDASRTSYGYGGIQDLHLPACTDPDGCRTELRVLGDWRGGPADDGATIDWTLGASLFSLDASARIEADLVIEAGEIAELPVRPAGHVAGTLATGGKDIQGRTVAITLARDAVAGVVEGDAREVRSGIALQATMTAATSSRSGSTKSVLLHLGHGFNSGPAGSRIAVTSEAVPVACGPSTCTATIAIDAWDYDVADEDVTVDWAIDVGLVLDPGVAVKPGTTVSFSVSGNR